MSKGFIEPVEVSISGSVSRPGVYSVHAGTRIGDLIKKCRPKQFADLRGIDLDGLIENSIHLAIPELTEITVRITGAVSGEVEFTVPVRSRICDLKSKVQLDDCADVDFFKRRRVLKSEEVIVIPRKEKKAKGLKIEAKHQELAKKSALDL